MPSLSTPLNEYSITATATTNALREVSNETASCSRRERLAHPERTNPNIPPPICMISEDIHTAGGIFKISSPYTCIPNTSRAVDKTNEKKFTSQSTHFHVEDFVRSLTNTPSPHPTASHIIIAINIYQDTETASLGPYTASTQKAENTGRATTATVFEKKVRPDESRRLPLVIRDTVDVASELGHALRSNKAMARSSHRLKYLTSPMASNGTKTTWQSTTTITNLHDMDFRYGCNGTPIPTSNPITPTKSRHRERKEDRKLWNTPPEFSSPDAPASQGETYASKFGEMSSSAVEPLTPLRTP
mmetsp:Transcript_20875/g.30040  ORF Transcript_20875/g.30040 Transcript_20875/m.30040 type:complete len:302 (-) Transcript_20875:1231-2136(-)